MNMFNSRGEVNASSVKEALQVIAKYASIMQDNMPSNVGLANGLAVSEDQKDELVARAIMNQDGKIALAQAMANPIR